MRGRGAGASVALGVVAMAVLLTGCASTPTGALSRLAHLDQGAAVADQAVPPVVAHVDADLIDSSVRLLAEHDGTAFWVGATSSDDVCFVAAPAPAGLEETAAPSSAGAGGAGSSAPGGATAGFGPPATDAPELPVPSLRIDQAEAVCLSPESFGAHGATLRVGADRTRVWLHTEYMTVSPGWVPIAQNIAVKA